MSRLGMVFSSCQVSTFQLEIFTDFYIIGKVFINFKKLETRWTINIFYEWKITKVRRRNQSSSQKQGFLMSPKMLCICSRHKEHQYLWICCSDYNCWVFEWTQPNKNNVSIKQKEKMGYTSSEKVYKSTKSKKKQ